MAEQNRGIAVVSGSTPIHKLMSNGVASFSGSVCVTGTVVPEGDGVRILGSSTNRWQDVYALQTTVGAIFETGLTTYGLGQYKTGTVVIWENGLLVPCYKHEDNRVVGAVREGKDQPIILGAEDVLVTGKVKEGDWIVTSDKVGHGKSAKINGFFGRRRDLFGKVIGQALENASGESTLIKCFIQRM